jgi:hypothetical protein
LLGGNLRPVGAHEGGDGLGAGSNVEPQGAFENAC